MLTNNTINTITLPVSTIVTVVPSNTPITQNVIADPNNSSSTNLDANTFFTGISTSTLGIVGIQVSLKTDQNCIVYIDQSPDGTNWDIIDFYNYYYSKGGNGWTVQAVNSYVRIRVKNIGSSATTYFRLQTALCPIVEAVPRTLNENGLFKTISELKDHYDWDVEATPMGELRTVQPYKLVGASFTGNILDTNYFLSTGFYGASATQGDGQITLATNADFTNGAVSVITNRRARYIGGSSLRYRSVIQLGDTGVSNNVRRWGVANAITTPAISTVDGAMFMLSGTTFGIVTIKNGTETSVYNGSFNGKLGSLYDLTTAVNTYEIYWTNSKVYFVIGDNLLHTVYASAAPWSSTMSLYGYIDNINSNNLQEDHKIYCRTKSIYRLGELQSQPTYKHISTATTTICKYGAGNLHKVIVNDPTNNKITIYDNTAGSGTVIAIIDPDNGATPFELIYDLPFSNGLTVVTAGIADVTITYE